MRILHLGDLHIGKSVNDYSMIDDQAYILQQILDIIEKRQIEAVLIAGDVYDRAVPSEEAVRLLNEFLCQLAERRIWTFLISGNHDSDERLNFGSALFESNGIYIASKYTGGLYKQTLTDAYGEIDFYLLPFVKASQVRHFFPEEEIDSYDQAVRVVLEHAGIDRSRRSVLVAHQFVVAGSAEEPQLGGSESVAAQAVGAVEKIDVDCFDDFDYVALGHIHSPQHVGRQEVRYCGSPLKYSLSEIDREKSVPVVTMEEKGRLSVELVPLLPRRDMRHLRGRLEQLLDRKHVTDTEDYIYVTLTDEDPIPEAMTIIRQHYPNTMKLDYDNAHTRETERIDFANMAQNRTFSDLIADFYQMMYGCGISDEELELMREVAGEAGVVDETD